MESERGIEPPICLLQRRALPLGYSDESRPGGTCTPDQVLPRLVKSERQWLLWGRAVKWCEYPDVRWTLIRGRNPGRYLPITRVVPHRRVSLTITGVKIRLPNLSRMRGK